MHRVYKHRLADVCQLAGYKMVVAAERKRDITRLL